MPLLDGVIHVCGEPDTGKTTFALESGAAPGKILFFDDDVKGHATIKELESQGIQIGSYVDLKAIQEGKTELEFHNFMIKKIRDVDNYDLLIWDTWTAFANTCHSYVVTNPSKFRKNYSPMGKIKGAQEWQDARRLEGEIINFLTQKFKTVILITHLKDSYVNNVKVPSKMQPACSSELEKIARLRIWLRHNPDGRPVPIALILKRLSKKQFTNNQLRTINVLPRKIIPNSEQHSVWDAIWDYWENPVGDRPPTPEETPNEFELSILDSTLTADQRVMFNNILQSGAAIKDEEEALDVSFDEDNKTEKAKFLVAQGKAKPLVAKELGITLPELNGLLTEATT